MGRPTFETQVAVGLAGRRPPSFPHADLDDRGMALRSFCRGLAPMGTCREAAPQSISVLKISTPKGILLLGTVPSAVCVCGGGCVCVCLGGTLNHAQTTRFTFQIPTAHLNRLWVGGCMNLFVKR